MIEGTVSLKCSRCNHCEVCQWVDLKMNGCDWFEEEQKTGHWIYKNENWHCSECDETPKTLGYVGDADFMKEHFKFCNHCGCRMSEVSE